MHVSRSRLIAVVAALLATGGGALTAGSFASGRSAVPAAAGKTASGSAQRTFVSAASGLDTNPCTRTAPCRNFQAAIAQTLPGGEVIALDSGGYGPVTISQAVALIAPAGVYAGISVFSGAGITINAGPSDVVTIRGLTLNGLGGNNGIEFFSGAALHVQDGVFKNFGNAGIVADTSADANLIVEDSLFARSGSEGVVLTTTAGTIKGTIEHSRFEDGSRGVEAAFNSNVVVRDSVVSGSASAGFFAEIGSQLDIENSLVTHNTDGLVANNGSMRVSETTIEENNTGLTEFGVGTIASFGNNRLAGNTTNGSFTSTIPLQ